MQKFFTSIIIFLTCFSGVFASSETLKKLNDENKKIQNEIEKILDKQFSLQTQLNLLEKTLEQLEVEKKIFLEKRREFQKNLEKNIGEKSNIDFVKDVNKEEFLNFILKLHREEKKIETNGEENFVKLFFTKNGIGNYFKELNYFEIIGKISQRFFQSYELIGEKKSDEIAKNARLKKEISKLDQKILENSQELLQIKNAKETLAKYYSQQKNLFEEKLKENKKAMLLSLLETKKVLLKQKEIDKKINIGYEKIQKIEQNSEIGKNEIKKNSDDPYDVIGFSDLDDKKFIWPIDKNRGITAKFLDPEYEKRFGIKHYAIDIRAKQGTKIHAPANAFVYKVEKGGSDGMGYAYIILAHKGSIQTVYGHISKSLVKEGDIVLKGQIFALTGGMPGTPGAGPLTTGPHLHLEFHENGKPVNPLKFLD
ncbi:peptidoglycan DD-metalloendopeptidase family protein [Candidatus Gracilibacteria bacterium]|nr:peptidoglycan DD-metalloendopeptidase family protein [Candidatus Gracilibacteria bacterium]